MAGLYSRSALERRLAAIGHQHRLRGLDWSAGHPAIRTTLRGIYRQHGSRRQATALTSVELRKLVAACPGDLAGLRDRALLLLLGFAGALRRSEPVGIDREHLRVTEAGLRVLLPSSKTDQEGGSAAKSAKPP
jgi:site-specific recombinase XerC